MTNYFGVSRLKKIAKTYLEERNYIIPKSTDFHYSKYHGDEWIEIYFSFGETEYKVKFYASGISSKFVSADEYIFDNDDFEYKLLTRTTCHYTSDFRPFSGHSNLLDCYDISKK